MICSSLFGPGNDLERLIKTRRQTEAIGAMQKFQAEMAAQS